jgi:hypothetical protein
MNDPSVAALLATFDFPDEWIKFRFVDESYLQNLYEQYLNSDDKNQEHYRYRAFQDVLESEALTNRPEFLEHYLRLAELDPDFGMAKAALYNLLFSKAVTITQRATLRKTSLFSDKRFQL